MPAFTGGVQPIFYRRGSADAARSRATAPAATKAEPTAILGLRRCTARGTRRKQNTPTGASPAIASTVSRRGLRRPVRTRRDYPRDLESRGVPHKLAGRGCCPGGSRDLQAALAQQVLLPLDVLLRLGPGRRFGSKAPCHQREADSAGPRGQGPLPAARGPLPGPDGGLSNNGDDRRHPLAYPRGPSPVQTGHQEHPRQQPAPAVITSHPAIVARAARGRQSRTRHALTSQPVPHTPARSLTAIRASGPKKAAMPGSG